MNTAIRYHEFDSDTPNPLRGPSARVVLSGALTESGLRAVMAALEPGHVVFRRPGVGYFIPNQVGLPRVDTLRGWADRESLSWHALAREGLEETLDPPTLEMDFAELVERFQAVRWDPRAG